MAKDEKKVVEEVQPTETKKEQAPEKVESEGGNMKAPAKNKATKPKKLVQQEPTVTKVDLSKPVEEQPKDDNVAKVDLSKKEEPKEEVKEEVVEEVKDEQQAKEPKEEAVV